MTVVAAPRVSVVIPAYNAAAFLERTLDSVRGQTYRDWELMIVDDGSSDDTHGVADRYLVRHGLPGRVVRQPNLRIAAARNAGLRAAHAPYVALLDHDDLWYPDKLAVVMAEFDRHPDVDLVCHHENIVRDGLVLRVSRNGPAGLRMYERLLFCGNALSPSASVFRRDRALAVGGFRENPEFNTVEDYDFWMRLSRVARFHFVDRVLGEYQVVERAASRRVEYHHGNMEAMLRDHFAAYFGERPGWIARLRIRRRLSVVYRSALSQLMGHGELPLAQRQYVRRMLVAFPLDPKNLVRAMQWALSSRRHRMVVQA